MTGFIFVTMAVPGLEPRSVQAMGGGDGDAPDGRDKPGHGDKKPRYDGEKPGYDGKRTGHDGERARCL